MDKLASSDHLIMELYTENARLLQTLHLQNLSQSTASGLSMWFNQTPNNHLVHHLFYSISYIPIVIKILRFHVKFWMIDSQFLVFYHPTL